jgi:hypothetical protein
VHGLDVVEGKINNDDVSVLRDTGCSTVFVHSKPGCFGWSGLLTCSFL